MGGKINSIEELKALASFNGGFDCYIRLGSGLLRSSKHISFDGEFHIHHEIDDSFEIMSEDDIIDSHIGLAISRGALMSY